MYLQFPIPPFQSHIPVQTLATHIPNMNSSIIVALVHISSSLSSISSLIPSPLCHFLFAIRLLPFTVFHYFYLAFPLFASLREFQVNFSLLILVFQRVSRILMVTNVIPGSHSPCGYIAHVTTIIIAAAPLLQLSVVLLPL